MSCEAQRSVHRNTFRFINFYNKLRAHARKLPNIISFLNKTKQHGSIQLDAPSLLKSS